MWYEAWHVHAHKGLPFVDVLLLLLHDKLGRQVRLLEPATWLPSRVLQACVNLWPSRPATRKFVSLKSGRGCDQAAFKHAARCAQALTYDLRKERERDVKDFMEGGAAAVIQARPALLGPLHLCTALASGLHLDSLCFRPMCAAA